MRGSKRPLSERVTAVALAEVRGIPEAARMTGIPETTIRPWMDRPEYVELRSKTRDELAEGFKALAHLSMTRLLEAVQAGTVEPRDLTILLGVATDKHLLMTGGATARTETRSLADELDDHERALLKQILTEEMGGDSEATGDPVVGLDAGAPPVTA